MEIKGQQVSEKSFDVLIVGGGGSGLRAALEISKSGLEVAVISKVFPTRSHTVAAQGGITCAIASADPCLLYTSPSPRDRTRSRMPSSA